MPATWTARVSYPRPARAEHGDGQYTGGHTVEFQHEPRPPNLLASGTIADNPTATVSQRLSRTNRNGRDSRGQSNTGHFVANAFGRVQDRRPFSCARQRAVRTPTVIEAAAAVTPRSGEGHGDLTANEENAWVSVKPPRAERLATANRQPARSATRRCCAGRQVVLGRGSSGAGSRHVVAIGFSVPCGRSQGGLDEPSAPAAKRRGRWP